MQQITPSMLRQWLSEGRQPLTLLDVREPWEYEHCRIEGSILIPMAQVPARVRELDRDVPVVVICHHGVRSFQVARFLEHGGFSRVYNLHGGVDAYAVEADSSMPRY